MKHLKKSLVGLFAVLLIASLSPSAWADLRTFYNAAAVAITGGTIAGVTITTSTYNGNTLTTGSSTYTGTAAQTYTFPTTSATIARTDAANTFTGHQTIEGVTSTGATGTGKFAFDTLPQFTTGVGVGIAPLASLQTKHSTVATQGVLADTSLFLGSAGNSNETVTLGFGFANGGTVNDTAAIVYLVTNNAGQQAGDLLFMTRSVTTDTAPTERLRINKTGDVLFGGSLFIGATAPVYASGGCSTQSAVTSNGTSAFSIQMTGTCTGSQPIVFTLPAAAHTWACDARDITTATNAPKQTGAASTTSVTITNYVLTTGLAGAWTTNDVVEVRCSAY